MSMSFLGRGFLVSVSGLGEREGREGREGGMYRRMKSVRNCASSLLIQRYRFRVVSPRGWSGGVYCCFCGGDAPRL